jgi:hypothetical protein
MSFYAKGVLLDPFAVRTLFCLDLITLGRSLDQNVVEVTFPSSKVAAKVGILPFRAHVVRPSNNTTSAQLSY